MLSRVCQTAGSLLIKIGPALCEDWLTYRGRMEDLRMMSYTDACEDWLTQ